MACGTPEHHEALRELARLDARDRRVEGLVMDLMGEIARTGRVRFPWRETRVAVAALAVAALARAARRAASRAFADDGDGDGLNAVRASSPASFSLDAALERAETHSLHVETRLTSFPEPPFTTQRLVELLMDPEASGYQTPETLRRACDKLLAVTGMTAISSYEQTEGPEGALEQSAHERRSKDPVSLEQSAFVRALVGEAEAKREEDEDCLLVRQAHTRGEETTHSPQTESAVAESASTAEPHAAFPGEALPLEAGAFVAGVLEPRPCVERSVGGSVGEKRAREGERQGEPSFAEEMDSLERRLPGTPDVGAELVTAGA